MTSFNYDDKMISWECKCCNGMKYYNRDRGSTIVGTTGTVLVDRDGYEVLRSQREQDERVQDRQGDVIV